MTQGTQRQGWGRVWRQACQWGGVAACLMGAWTAAAQAADYPSRPITLVVPATTGGSSDIVGRLLAEGLARELGQRVVVENKAGAGGIVASSYVLDRPADGYTLMLALSSKTVLKAMQESLPFDPVRDLRTIALVSRVPTVLVVSAKLGVRDFAAFKAYAQQHPGKVSWAVPGIGTAPHLTGQLLTRAMPAQVTEVQYRGSAPMHVDLVAGRVDIATDSYAALKPHIDSGAVVPIATIGHSRIEQLPGVPTLGELGYEDFKTLLLDGWNAVDVRTGTPPEIVSALSAGIQRVLSDSALRDRVRQQGVVLFDPQTPEQAQAFVVRTTDIIRPLATELGAATR